LAQLLSKVTVTSCSFTSNVQCVCLLLNDALLKCVVIEVVLFSVVAFKTLQVSQGSVATHEVLLKIFSWFWQWKMVRPKLVNIWWSYKAYEMCQFWPPCMLGNWEYSQSSLEENVSIFVGLYMFCVFVREWLNYWGLTAWHKCTLIRVSYANRKVIVIIIV